MSRTEQQRVVQRFPAALTTGAVRGLLGALAPDVLVVGDGGGLAPAALHPVAGRERAVALLPRFAPAAPGAAGATLLLNGAGAARPDPAGALHTVATFVVEDGRVARLHAIRNPHKLGRLDKEGGAAAVTALRVAAPRRRARSAPPEAADTPELGSLLLFSVGAVGLGGDVLARARRRLPSTRSPAHPPPTQQIAP